MAYTKYDDGDQRFGQPRKMYQGDWVCASCGAKITELPFLPDPGKSIYCRECYTPRKTRRFEGRFERR